ncbi:hypothetical protein BCU00_019985 [Vibrio breoganii]
MLEREKAGQGLTRPELSVLVAYGKMVLSSKDLLVIEAAHEKRESVSR